jgi:hypothetical protein
MYRALLVRPIRLRPPLAHRNTPIAAALNRKLYSNGSTSGRTDSGETTPSDAKVSSSKEVLSSLEHSQASSSNTESGASTKDTFRSEAEHNVSPTSDRSSVFTHYSDAPRPSTGSEVAPADDFVSRMRIHAREWATSAAIRTRLTTDDLVVRLSRTLAKAGGEINRVTGYEQIDALKHRVVEQGA